MRAPDQIEKDHPETDLMTQAIIRGAEGYRVAVPLMEAWDALPRSVQVAICMEFADLRADLHRPAPAQDADEVARLREALRWYEEQVRMFCTPVPTSEAEAAFDALMADMGSFARAALASPTTPTKDN